MFHAFSLKKQLWRRWKRWKKAPWVGAGCAAVLLLAGPGAWIPGRMTDLLENRRLPEVAALKDAQLRTVSAEALDDSEPSTAVFESVDRAENSAWTTMSPERVKETIRHSPMKRRVHFRSVYANGEEVHTQPGMLDSGSVLQLLHRYPDWQPQLAEDGDVWLERRIDELSPACRGNAFIGIDAMGRLTLFQGPPRQEKALRTFFQMDMGSLKSSLPEEIWQQLREGIRVQDADEYRSVLSTFSDYAREGSEQALRSE